MNKYPEWWDTTLTIYNKYEHPQTHVITWYRHALNNCFWKRTIQSVTMSTVEITTDNTIVRIPENKQFLETQVWVTKTSDQISSYFTLTEGDIIVRGSVSDAISEYESGKRSSDLIAKYKTQGCIVIQSVTNDTGVARGLPHYHVTGT